MKLTEIGISNFKCYKDEVNIPVKNINLFTGVNGKGKSTALQPLLLMRQSIEHSSNTEEIILNGNCIELGSYTNIRNRFKSEHDPIVFSYKSFIGKDEFTVKYYFNKNHLNEQSANLKYISISGIVKSEIFEFNIDLRKNNKQETSSINSDFTVNVMEDLFISENDLKSMQGNMLIQASLIKKYLNFSRVHYVSADRLGPRNYYPMKNIGRFIHVGKQGEYTATILYQLRNNTVHKTLLLEEASTETLEDQTSVWLSKIFDGGKLKVKSSEAGVAIIELGSSDSISDTNRPVNEGFGLSSVLPIVVSGLIARAGDILIIENPEIHLHPSAQVQLAHFLVNVSKCEVQIFIETHSEHFLNALRIDVKDEVIDASEVGIVYFQKQEKGIRPEFIQINKDGSIEKWPEKFFDQAEKDLKRLYGF
ncbi:MAG: DUF3696 domain-containing protein [Nitrospirae bacterium]|nr:DUF3696 domain-containing protein [Nitrospirota bacterium]